jgi:hypothetical protein
MAKKSATDDIVEQMSKPSMLELKEGGFGLWKCGCSRPQKNILRATHENRGAQFLMLFSFTSVNTGIINVARVAVAGKRRGFEG